MTHPNGDGARALAFPDRSPPLNLEAERSLLGSCMLDDRMIDECVAVLGGTGDDFFRADHGETWTALVDLRDRGRPADAVSLADALIRRGRFDAMGGDEFLRSLVESVPHAANAAYYAGIVREKAIGRRLLEACEAILKACYSRQHTAAELVAMAEQAIFAIAEREAGSDVADMGTIVDEAMAAILRRRMGEVDGIDVGFDDLDDILAGLRPGQLVVIGARPSIGKSALGMAIAANVGAITGKPALFISLEMGRQEIAERYLSAWGEVSAYALKGRRPHDRLSEPGWSNLCNAAGHLSSLPFRIDDTPGRTVSQIAATARRLARSCGLSLIVIDYLGLIDTQQRDQDSMAVAVGRVSRALKQMAREIGVPVTALHQLNRKAEDREDRRPRMSDLRDSGSIEQDADIVLLLHRPEYYDPAEKPGIAEVIVAKNRNGATGAVELAFRKEWTRFDSVSYRDDEAPAGLSDETSF